jgi:glutathione S-transferase
MPSALTLVGRSSSHFTRIVRIYAVELGSSLAFEPVLELMSPDAEKFGGNPLLTVPSLRTPEGTWYGALNCCRVLARQAPASDGLLWPEDMLTLLSANAQEVTLSAMNAGVPIIMGRSAKLTDDHPTLIKPLARLRGAIRWLDEHLDAALADLPPRRISFLEISAFSLLTHLSFRGLGTLDAAPRLAAFCSAFAERPSARATEYRFD